MKNFCSLKPVKSVLAQYICEFMILDAWHWNKCKYETVSKVAKDELNRKITLVQSRSTPQGGWSSSCREGKRETTPDDTDSMGVFTLKGVPQNQKCEILDCPVGNLFNRSWASENCCEKPYLSPIWPLTIDRWKGSGLHRAPTKHFDICNCWGWLIRLPNPLFEDFEVSWRIWLGMEFLSQR